MQRELMLRLALGCAGILSSGALLGQALANYVESGSFHFYRQAHAYAWRDSATEVRPIDFAVQMPSAAHEAGLIQTAAFDR